MRPGHWLVRDHDENMRDFDLSVWRWEPNSPRLEQGVPHDQMLVAWAGNIPFEQSDSAAHATGWPKRYSLRKLDDTQLAQLLMAAEHGAFYAVAPPLWEKLE